MMHQANERMIYVNKLALIELKRSSLRPRADSGSELLILVLKTTIISFLVPVWVLLLLFLS